MYDLVAWTSVSLASSVFASGAAISAPGHVQLESLQIASIIRAVDTTVRLSSALRLHAVPYLLAPHAKMGPWTLRGAVLKETFLSQM